MHDIIQQPNKFHCRRRRVPPHQVDDILTQSENPCFSTCSSRIQSTIDPEKLKDIEFATDAYQIQPPRPRPDSAPHDSTEQDQDPNIVTWSGPDGPSKPVKLTLNLPLNTYNPGLIHRVPLRALQLYLRVWYPRTTPRIPLHKLDSRHAHRHGLRARFRD
jgi:hypothetical protein